MFEIINFSNWDKYEAPHGSGASEKIWLLNKTKGQSGVFKFPKIKSDGTITGEYWSEKFACELGKILDIKCAEVDLGIYNGRLGSMSYNFLNNNEILIEGIIKNEMNPKNIFSPLYDNGSSLCCFIDGKMAKQILKDKLRFNALINTKSYSAIGWKNQRQIRHFELLNYLKENYYHNTIV